MSKKYTVEVGQKWIDTDPRMEGRYVHVVRIEDGYAYCQRPNFARMTRLSVVRMEYGDGWRLVP